MAMASFPERSLQGPAPPVFVRIGFLLAWLAAAASAAAAPAGPSPAAEPAQVERIDVVYQYLGWGSYEERFRLEPARDGGFVLRGQYVDQQGKTREVQRSVPATAVAALAAQASAPAWPRARGVAALAARVQPEAVTRMEDGRVRIPPSPCTVEEREQRAKQVLHSRGLEAMVDDYYGNGLTWTDDYPSISVSIVQRGQAPRRFYSVSQKPMMLPWHYDKPRNGRAQGEDDWSPLLSRALQDVLPPESSAHRRLEWEPLQRGLRGVLDFQVTRACSDGRPSG